MTPEIAAFLCEVAAMRKMPTGELIQMMAMQTPPTQVRGRDRPSASMTANGRNISIRVDLLDRPEAWVEISLPWALVTKMAAIGMLHDREEIVLQ